MRHEVGSYLITPLLLVLVFSGIAGLFISLYLLKYKRSSGLIYLALMQFGTAAWAFFYGLEYAATSLSLKIFWSKLSYFGIVFTPVFFYLFSLHFASKHAVITRKLKIGLLSLASLFLLLVLTNDLHFLHWTSYSINPEFNTTNYEYGILFWLVFMFCYTLLFLSIINIVSLIFEFPENFHTQIILLTMACIFPVVGNLMYIFNVSPVPGFDWTPIFFVFSGLALTFMNVRYGTFDLVPIARNKFLDMLPDGIAVVDRHQRIIDVNPAFLRLTQQDRNDILGKSLVTAFPKIKSLMEQLAPKEILEPIELDAEIHGETIYFDLRITPLYDPKNSLSGQLITLRDITEKTVYEQKINQTNQQLKLEIEEKEKLIADLDAFDHTVAHDLKNIIGAIVTSTDLIQYEVEQQNFEDLSEIIELIQLSANKSLHVIKELLTLASVRQQDVKSEPVDMLRVFEESEKRLADMIKTSGATIIKPKDWPSAYGYGPWIEEVWVNFLSNAIKYGGKPPVIELGYSQFYSEKKIRYWIKDNGDGLSPPKQKKLFKKYERFNQSQIEGTGLGLSIVKRIVEKLGGDVGVISNAIPGEGCIFYFTLPQD